MLRSLVGSEMCIRDSINAEYGEPKPHMTRTLTLLALAAAVLALPTTMAEASVPSAHFSWGPSYSATGTWRMVNFDLPPAPASFFRDTTRNRMRLALDGPGGDYFMFNDRSVIVSEGAFPNNTVGPTGSDLTCFHLPWSAGDQERGYANLSYVHPVSTSVVAQGWLYVGMAIDVGSNGTQIGATMIVDPHDATLREFIFAQNWPNTDPSFVAIAAVQFDNVTLGPPQDHVFELPGVCGGHA
eukprot:TRINITY_DN1357_c0_g1_i6.p1 TRINITY_DN1357_c0_g1~~TRINITY_DN1357_c0_g1_i6.p1  ORF type:complete len:279 (+),score=66.67 TRINITY_DN1357_c0_g1_i6:115-837(+)